MKLLKNHKVFSVLIVILVATLFSSLVYKTPLFADDYSYFYSFKEADGTEEINQTITNAEELILSQIGHYGHVNGRIFAHTLAQIFVSLDKTVFNIVATLAFCALGVLICVHGLGSLQRISPLPLLAVYTSLFLFAPSFGQSYLWMTGACNYLITFVLVLLFLLPYRISFSGNKKTGLISTTFKAVLMMAVGVIAGNTNENTACAMIVVLAIYLVAYFLKYGSLKIWMITGWVGAVGGCILMLFAPGNSIRMGSSSFELDIKSVLISVIRYTADMVEIVGPLLAAISLIVVSYAYKNRKTYMLSKDAYKILMDKHFFAIFYGLFFLGAVYAMVIPAQFPARAWSHPLAVILIVTVYMGDQLYLSQGRQIGTRIVNTLCVLLLVALMTVFIKGSFAVNTVAMQQATRVNQIQRAKQDGKEQVCIPSIVSGSRFVCQDEMGDISDDTNHWINEAMAKYYGIDIVCKSGEVYS